MDDEEISYKTLRKIQQAEKNSPQITKINKEFYQDVTRFLHELETRLGKEKKPQKQMLLAEECQNIEKIIRNIYEQREKKIMLAAIAKARGGNPTIKTLLPEEKTFFDELYHNVVLFRKKIFKQNQEEEDHIKHESESRPVPEKSDNGSAVKKEKGKEEQKNKQNQSNTHPILRIVDDIPPFVGTDNNTYSLYKGDILSLPEDMADMLLNKKVAVKINES
ncbi:MAG: hypothetical protein R6U21_06620 [Thermoplasmatota archaeon]